MKGETLVLPSHVSYSRITLFARVGKVLGIGASSRFDFATTIDGSGKKNYLTKIFLRFFFQHQKARGGRLVDKTKKERKYRKFCPELCFTLIYRNIHYIQPLSIIIVLISAYFWPVDDWKGKEKIQKPDNKEVAKEATHRSKGKKVLASSKIVSFSKKTFFLNAFH